MKLKGHNQSLGISRKDELKIIKRDIVCVYCKTQVYRKGEEGFTKRKELTMDHINPIENGGNNEFNNLVLACHICNSGKRTKNVLEWCKEKNIEVPEIVIELLKRQKEQTIIGGDEKWF